MELRHALVLVLIALTASVGSAFAQQTPDARVADLVKSGKLQSVYFAAIHQGTSNRRAKSVWVETARALAARIGVELVLLERLTPPKVVECLKAGECDVVFLPFDERAANVGDFSSPFIQFEYTLLVPAGSSIRTIPNADRVGVRIAAMRITVLRSR